MMTMQDRIKAALGEFLFNQLAMQDQIEQLRNQVSALTSPKPEEKPEGDEK